MQLHSLLPFLGGVVAIFLHLKWVVFSEFPNQVSNMLPLSLVCCDKISPLRQNIAWVMQELVHLWWVEYLNPMYSSAVRHPVSWRAHKPSIAAKQVSVTMQYSRF